MTIRVKLFLSIATVITLSFIIAIVFLFTTMHVNKAMENGQKSDKTVREIFHLTILLNDYLMHQEERSASQWQIKHKQIGNLLTSQDYNASEDKAILNNVVRHHKHASDNFVQLVKTYENDSPEELQNRLISRLLINSQTMVSNSEALSEKGYKERERSLRNAVIVITALVGLLIALTTILFILLYKSIVDPIAKLNRGTIAITEGNWNYKVPIKRNDEVGQLAKAFNNMTTKIASYIDEQKQLERQKDDFIAAASHELKTPLTSMRIYTHALQKKLQLAQDTHSVELLQKMNLQLKKLLNVINDLLDVQKIEGGKLHYTFDFFDLNELMNEIVQDMQLTTDDHQIVQKLTKNRTVYGERAHIGQVLTNFLSNAIKYSPNKKQIIVSTSIQDKYITVSVKDFGVGIAKEDQKKVFERFFRAGGDIEKTYPGIGLGLYISSKIIKKHRGKIWVKSQKSKGSTFSFLLPIRNEKK